MIRKLPFSWRGGLIASALWLASAGSAHSALIIPFSFGDTSGTVLGEIFGLDIGEADQAATSVTIVGSPFMGSIGDYVLSTPQRNRFDVDAGGVVTLADFVGDFFGENSRGFRLDLAGPAGVVVGVEGNRALLDELGGGARQIGAAPAVPDIFSPPVAEVPEPASLSLFGVGLMAFAFARRRVGSFG